MYTMEPWQWVAAFLGAVIIGLSKTGIAGIGILLIALFALAIPARQSVGVVLPLLICGDLLAWGIYRRHARWKTILKLFPWAAGGVLIGVFVMQRAGDREIAAIIGAILLSLVGLHFLRKRIGAKQLEASVPASAPGFSCYPAATGIMAGFTTMVANAAGPVMILYLLSMRLPKMEFLGTGAIFFLVLNLFKVPFGVHLDIINTQSLLLDLKLLPGVFLGAFLGRWLIGRIRQEVFEGTALFFTVLAAVHLVYSSL